MKFLNSLHVEDFLPIFCIDHLSFISDKSNIGYHTEGNIAAGSPVALASTVEVEAYKNIFVRLHGAFMIGAWISTASCGMLLARYYKNTWVGTQFCGKDLWFVVGFKFH